MTSKFLALFLLLTPVATLWAATDEIMERREITHEAGDAYRNGDFNRLETLFNRYTDYRNQRTSSGAFKIQLFYDGIGEAMDNTGEAVLKDDINRTLKWVQLNKQSPLAYELHAGALLRYGGYYRGRGYSNTVTPQAWELYKEYHNKATKFMFDNKTVASLSPTWHTSLIMMALGGNWKRDIVIELFEDGVKKHPYNFALYVAAVEYFLPKWHGDISQLDRLIRRSTEVAPNDLKGELYARLYSSAEQSQFNRNLYSSTLVDWELMKSGLADWTRRFPTEWTRNIFAYHACIAGDKETTATLMKEVGTNPRLEVWAPNAEATYSSCLNWANDPNTKSFYQRNAGKMGNEGGKDEGI